MQVSKTISYFLHSRRALIPFVWTALWHRHGCAELLLTGANPERQSLILTFPALSPSLSPLFPLVPDSSPPMITQNAVGDGLLRLLNSSWLHSQSLTGNAVWEIA